MSRIPRLLVALLLALLAGAPATLLAACGDCHPCCRPLPVASVGAPPCCTSLKAAPANPGLPGTFSLVAAPAPLATATEGSGESPRLAEAAPEPLPTPPPLHEGTRLHTFYATFLI